MSDLSEGASQASQRFGEQALDYDRYRPRYPESLFDDIIADEVGAAAKAMRSEPGPKSPNWAARRARPCLDRHRTLAEMAAIAKVKLADRAQMFVGRFGLRHRARCG